MVEGNRVDQETISCLINRCIERCCTKNVSIFHYISAMVCSKFKSLMCSLDKFSLS